MKKYISVLVSLLILVFSSCKKDKMTDEEAIQELVNSSYLFSQYSAIGSPDTSGAFLRGAPINPIFWYREAKNYPQPELDIHVIGDSAYVELTGYVEGTLHIWDFPSMTKYTKNFSDKAQIKGIFKRTGDADGPHKGWQLWAVSGILANSYTSPSFSIDSFEVFFGSTKIMTIKDPFTWFILGEIDSATVSDTLGMNFYSSSDSIDPYFHFFGQGEHFRSQMTKDPTGTYIPLKTTTSGKSGYHWIVADVLSYSTLHDSEANYSSLLWFALFYVK